MKHFDETSGGGGRDRKDPQDFDQEDQDEEEIAGADIHHDPWLIPSSPALKSLATSIFEQIEQSSSRPPRQRQDARDRRRAIMDNIVASLVLLVLHHAEGTRMAISAWNKAQTRYDRPKFPREVFMQTVGEMEDAALLVRRRGTRRQHRTTIEPTPSFRDRVTGLELGPMPIGREAGAETIILKASTGRGKPKVLIDYGDTSETEAMRADMQAVNAALNGSDLRLGGKPPTSPVFLTRRFQIDHPDAAHAFDQHGRLYGGPWINLPKTQRHLLRVNGEEVADLDFTGMFSQLAYLEAGLALPNSDPYGGIEGLSRDAVKLGLSALLCRTGPMLRLPTELRKMLGREWNAERLSAAIAERHPGIAPLFGKGIGLKLMHTESRILMAALRRLFERGIPALPMHDGLMVPASKEAAARTAMARASMQIVGVALPVTRKEIGGGPSVGHQGPHRRAPGVMRV